MLKELINRVRGQVWLRVTCPYPERVLNLCSARKLAFWDLEWEGTETFTCRMSRGDHRVLSRAAEKLDCTIEIVRREGAPYTLAKLRHRQALAAGIAACGAAVLIGSFFVWDIQIAGNETVPREVILRSLEKNGVHRGCFGFALNGEVQISANGSYRKMNKDGKAWTARLSHVVYRMTPTTLERPYLNPDWVEWLMGFPRKWTDIPFGPKNPPTSRA